MSTDKELLEDTSFDREIVPRDELGNLLISLLKHKAYDRGSAIEREKYPIREGDLSELIKLRYIESFSASPTKLYLTNKGKILAYGEYCLRERENK